MKVMLINVTCKKGSTGKITYDLYSALRKDGHLAVICYGRGNNGSESGIVKIGIDLETYFHAFMTRVTGLVGYFSYFSTRRLLRVLKEYEPDVVHIHEIHGYYVNVEPIVKYLKDKKIKTIWTFHCEFMYTGRCGYAYDCNNWRSSCGDCPHLNEYPKSLFFDFSKHMLSDKLKLLRNFDELTIVTPSTWLYDRVHQSNFKNKKTLVIRNGIETNQIFHPVNFAELQKRHNLYGYKVVLAVAPDLMQERKGGKWILKLAKSMESQKHVKFILIGVKGTLDHFGDNIITLPRTENQQELAGYYSMADVFVICSLMENFPTVCLESLCCGTPVCGFDVGGTKETVPEQLGYFVPYGDVDSLREAINLILSKNLKEECAEYGATHYSKEKMYEEYKKVYLY